MLRGGQRRYPISEKTIRALQFNAAAPGGWADSDGDLGMVRVWMRREAIGPQVVAQDVEVDRVPFFHDVGAAVIIDPMGHVFDRDLVCDCGRSHHEHQADPIGCDPTRWDVQKARRKGYEDLKIRMREVRRLDRMTEQERGEAWVGNLGEL